MKRSKCVFYSLFVFCFFLCLIFISFLITSHEQNSLLFCSFHRLLCFDFNSHKQLLTAGEMSKTEWKDRTKTTKKKLLFFICSVPSFSSFLRSVRSHCSFMSIACEIFVRFLFSSLHSSLLIQVNVQKNFIKNNLKTITWFRFFFSNIFIGWFSRSMTEHNV